LTKKSQFKKNQFEWGWCVETLEHIELCKQYDFVQECIRICRNIIFGFPTPGTKNFYSDPGHSYIKILWSEFGNGKNIYLYYSKSGRRIVILIDKKICKVIKWSKSGLVWRDHEKTISK
jgi:hypothetical protein